MKRLLLCLLSAVLIVSFSGCTKEQIWTSGSTSVYAKGEKADATLFAMDTYMSFTVYSPDAYELAVYAAERITELESTFDPDLQGSEVCLINREGRFAVGNEIRSQIETAAVVKERSGGAFDLTVGALVELWGFGAEPKVPAEEELVYASSLCGDILFEDNIAILPEGAKLNLGASAKGYTSNEIAQYLRENEVKSALISLGGNVQTVGAKPDGSPWRVAVQDPRDESTNLGVLSVKDTAVVTSGDYQRYFIEDGVRYCHILDPRTGKTVNNGVCSVTILCQDGLMADCLSTAMMVLGKEEAFAYWSTWGGFEMLVVTNDGTVTMTPGFNAVFETNNDLTYTVEVFGEE